MSAHPEKLATFSDSQIISTRNNANRHTDAQTFPSQRGLVAGWQPRLLWCRTSCQTAGHRPRHLQWSWAAAALHAHTEEDGQDKPRGNLKLDRRLQHHLPLTESHPKYVGFGSPVN